MKNDYREPSEEVIAVRVPAALAKEIRKHAREDDRTLSGWLRRYLAAAFLADPKDANAGTSADAGGRDDR